MKAIKLLDAAEGIVEGLAIPFSVDADGERFSADTKFFLDAYTARPLMYDHGLDVEIGVEPIGAEVKWEKQDGGLWLQAQISKAAKYREYILDLAAKGLLGYTTGANPRSVRKNADGLITQWMVIETSLSTIPANPDAMVGLKFLDGLAVYGVKSEGTVAPATTTANTSEPNADIARRLESLERRLNDRERREIETLRAENARIMEASNGTRE